MNHILDPKTDQHLFEGVSNINHRVKQVKNDCLYKPFCKVRVKMMRPPLGDHDDEQ